MLEPLRLNILFPSSEVSAEGGVLENLFKEVLNII
jgi:hypothetical protein